MKQLVVIFISLIVSCGQWKISRLESNKICSIKSGNKPGNISIRHETNGMLELSFRIKLYSGKIYTVDNQLKRVQVLDRDGSVSLIIGPRRADYSVTKGIKYANFNFSVIGKITVDSDERIYVQNRFLSKMKRGSRAKDEDLDFSPSYIIVFDKNGNLQYTLGRTGSPDMPFYYIESLVIDNDDRLLVVSRTFASWGVSRFTNKKRDFFINLGNIVFSGAKGEKALDVRIEKIAMCQSGDGFLIAVAYYNKSRFKYRKIFEYSIEKKKIVGTILNTPEPKNELFAVIDDKRLYLWDMKDRSVKFVICNHEGNIINNILLKLPKKNTLFGDILLDETGQFYSFHVTRNEIYILEWK